MAGPAFTPAPLFELSFPKMNGPPTAALLACEQVIELPPQICITPVVTVPVMTPATCKSPAVSTPNSAVVPAVPPVNTMNDEVAAEDVVVTAALNTLPVRPLLFQVAAMFMAGIVVVPVTPACVMFSGDAVEPESVDKPTTLSPLPVDA